MRQIGGEEQKNERKRQRNVQLFYLYAIFFVVVGFSSFVSLRIQRFFFVCVFSIVMVRILVHRYCTVSRSQCRLCYSLFRYYFVHFSFFFFFFFIICMVWVFFHFSKSILPAPPILHIYFQYVTFISVMFFAVSWCVCVSFYALFSLVYFFYCCCSSYHLLHALSRFRAIDVYIIFLFAI